MKFSENPKINIVRLVAMAIIGAVAILEVGNDIEVRDGFSPLVIKLLLGLIVAITIFAFARHRNIFCLNKKGSS